MAIAPASRGSTTKHQALGRLYVGCAGWSIPPECRDRFDAAGSHLQRYARKFSAVEINTSFHRPHRPSTYRRWAAAVPEHFRFAVKMPKQITHVLKLNNATESLGRFLEEVEELGIKLGPILIQLPPKLEFEREVARGFFQGMRERFSGTLVCEPRHPSWFEAPADGLLTDFAVARVAANPAVVPKAQNPGAYLGLAYFRLHGSPRIYYSAYGRESLEEIAIKLDRTRAMGVDAWCIFDNTAEGAAFANALELAEICEYSKARRRTKS